MIQKSGWFLLFLLLGASCLDDPDCFNLNNYYVGIRFKNKSDNKLREIAFTSIRTTGADTVFESNVTKSKIFFPLNFFQDTTTVILQQADRIDTIKFQYLSRPQFVSEDCGERYVLTDLAVVKHTFDSVRVLATIPAKTQTGDHVDFYRN